MKTTEALLIEGHETERARVGKQLHDDIGQRIAVLTMDLDALSKALPLPDPEMRARIDAIRKRAVDLAQDVQSLSRQLDPSPLEFQGLVSAAAAFCRDVSKRQQIEIVFSHRDVSKHVPGPAALAVFRILQEAVMNAAKHAGVRQLTVTLDGRPGEVRIEVVDNGAGFDPDAVLAGRAPGLAGMRQRAQLAGGELSIRSQPRAGTSISARVPLTDGDPANVSAG